MKEKYKSQTLYTCEKCQNEFPSIKELTKHAFVFPGYIREGYIYRYLKIEHMGENIHAKYNREETPKLEKQREKFLPCNP